MQADPTMTTLDALYAQRNRYREDYWAALRHADQIRMGLNEIKRQIAAIETWAARDGEAVAGAREEEPHAG